MSEPLISEPGQVVDSVYECPDCHRWRWVMESHDAVCVQAQLLAEVRTVSGQLAELIELLRAKA